MPRGHRIFFLYSHSNGKVVATRVIRQPVIAIDTDLSSYKYVVHLLYLNVQFKYFLLTVRAKIAFCDILSWQYHVHIDVAFYDRKMKRVQCSVEG